MITNCDNELIEGGKNMDEKVKARALKVKEHLDKLNVEEIITILRKSDKVIGGIFNNKYVNLNLLHNIVYNTCLIDKLVLLDFEMAISEKFDKPFKADLLDKTVDIPVQKRFTNCNEDCVKNIGDKYFTVYPIKDKKESIFDIIDKRKIYKKIDKNYAEEMKKEMNKRYRHSKDDIMSIADIYDTYGTICDIVSKAEMDSENSLVSIEDEIKKGIKEKLNIDTDYDIDVVTDEEGYKHVDVLPLIINIAKSIVGEDKFEMLQSFKTKGMKTDWDKVKEGCDKMKEAFEDNLHEEFFNCVKEHMEENPVKKEDSTDKILQDYVTEMVTKNLYFDEDLRERLKGTIYDAPIEVIKIFFEKHIQSINLSRLLNKDIFEEKDLDLALIETVRGFIFDADNQVYLIEFAIDLYTYYQIQE